MKKSNYSQNLCTHCAKLMNPTHPGYFLLDENAAFHLACGDEEIEVYTVHWDGELKHVACIEEVISYINDLERDTAITIKKRIMSRMQYLCAPEL